MQEIVRQHTIEVAKKVVGCAASPTTLILYAVDAGHFVLSAEPLPSLEQSALTTARASVTAAQDKYLIRLPVKIYNFYQIDESDYTIMASNKDPLTIIVSV